MSGTSATRASEALPAHLTLDAPRKRGVSYCAIPVEYCWAWKSSSRPADVSLNGDGCSDQAGFD
jgi:hypothetical protein